MAVAINISNSPGSGSPAFYFSARTRRSLARRTSKQFAMSSNRASFSNIDELPVNEAPELFYQPATPRASIITFDDSPNLSLGDRRRSYRRLPTTALYNDVPDVVESFPRLSIDTASANKDAHYETLLTSPKGEQPPSYAQAAPSSASSDHGSSVSFATVLTDSEACATPGAAGVPRIGKKSHARKRPDGHVKRPRNAFILFRSHAVQQGLVSKEVIKNQRNVSEVISQLWHNLSDEERRRWQENATAEKEEHLRLHPNYRYNPEATGTSNKRKSNVRPRSATIEKRTAKVADEILKSLGRDGLRKEAVEKGRSESRSVRRAKLHGPTIKGRASRNNHSRSATEGEDAAQTLQIPQDVTRGHRRSSSMPIHPQWDTVTESDLTQPEDHFGAEASPPMSRSAPQNLFTEWGAMPHSGETPGSILSQFNRFVPTGLTMMTIDEQQSRPQTAAGLLSVSQPSFPFGAGAILPISPRSCSFGNIHMPPPQYMVSGPNHQFGAIQSPPTLFPGQPCMPVGVAAAPAFEQSAMDTAATPLPVLDSAARRLSCFLHKAASESVLRERQAHDGLEQHEAPQFEFDETLHGAMSLDEEKEARLRHWRTSLSVHTGENGLVSLQSVLGGGNGVDEEQSMAPNQWSFYGLVPPSSLDPDHVEADLLAAAFGEALDSTGMHIQL